MKIFETMHERKSYWLVFNDDNEVVGKFKTAGKAQEYINKHKLNNGRN